MVVSDRAYDRNPATVMQTASLIDIQNRFFYSI